MARVTGIGGIFLRARDPKALTAWYEKHLKFPVSSHGTIFQWSDEIPKTTGMTVWSAFPPDTAYFGEPTQQVMVNYRVDDLDELLHELADADIKIDPKREDHEYGRFAWIFDPEGNRIELWQPLASDE